MPTSSHPAPHRLLPTAEPPVRSAPRPSLAGAVGPLDQAPRQAPRSAGHSPMPTVMFHRFNPAPKVYDASASGSAVEAGTPYDFDVFADGDVRLWRNDRKVPPHHKAALRAAILAAYRAATVTPTEALSAVVDRVEASQ